MKINEIERMSDEMFSGGKKSLKGYGSVKELHKLPGGSGLLYSIQNSYSSNDNVDVVDVKIWDQINKGEFEPEPINKERPSYYTTREWASRLQFLKYRQKLDKEEFDASPGKLVGHLKLYKMRNNFPLKGALQVLAITVDEDYRSMGIAKALYGIVLTIMKRPVVAGYEQTSGGRRNWASLSQIPGTIVKGYFSIRDADLDSTKNKQAGKIIDTIMGELGGQYIGKNSANLHFFAFDVIANTSQSELKSYINTELNKIYAPGSYDVGLYATWKK